MPELRVMGGHLRGRAIPLPLATKGHSEATPGRIKEAAFQHFDNHGGVEDRAFLDLYSGSGQMAIEAASRGANPVVAVEWDDKRRSAIREWCERFDLPVTVSRADAMRAAPRTINATSGDKCIFADPPYSLSWNGAPAALHLLRSIPEIEPPFVLLIQVPELNPRFAAGALLDEMRSLSDQVFRYGKSSLLLVARGT